MIAVRNAGKVEAGATVPGPATATSSNAATKAIEREISPAPGPKSPRADESCASPRKNDENASPGASESGVAQSAPEKAVPSPGVAKAANFR